MQELGWIKLHRKLRENPIYKNANLSRIFIELIFIANHKGAQIMWNGKMRNIDAGQCITGRFSMSKILAIKPTTIYSSWQKLKKMGFIDIESDNRNSLITILKYKQYQLLINDNDNSFDNSMTTDRQQNDTNNNNKNNKKSFINKTEEEKISPLPKEENLNEVNEIFRLFYESINPQINFGNKTDRKAVEFLINKYSYEKVLKFTKYAISIQGLEFAPVITTPSELKNRLAKLGIYFKKEKINKSQQKGFVSL